MFRRLIAITIFLLGNYSYSIAQLIDSKAIEDSSYHFYLTSKHNAQIKLSKKAINQGIDYHYLRYRLGVAYLGKRNFRKAIQQFEIASKMDPSSYETKALMRDCALAIGNDNLERFTRPFTGAKIGFLQQVYLESGIKQSSFVDTIGNPVFGQTGLQFALGRKVSMYTSYAFAYQNTLPLNFRQHQVYSLISIKPSINWQTNFYANGMVANVSLNQKDSVFNEYSGMAGVSISKQSGNWEWSFNAGIGNLNLTQQIQGGINLAWFPFGNDLLNLRLSSQVQKQKSEILPLFCPSSTIKLFKNCWIKGEYLYANTTNAWEQDGFIINNNPDKTLDKSTLLLTYKYAFFHDFYLVGQLEHKEIQVEGLPTRPYSFSNLILGYSYKLH